MLFRLGQTPTKLALHRLQHRALVLAQVQPQAGVDLIAAMHRLQLENAGDTLVVLTGPGVDLGPVEAARTAYVQVVVAILGSAATVMAPPVGVTLVAAATAVEFADRWNRMPGWS